MRGFYEEIDFVNEFKSLKYVYIYIHHLGGKCYLTLETSNLL